MTWKCDWCGNNDVINKIIQRTLDSCRPKQMCLMQSTSELIQIFISDQQHACMHEHTHTHTHIHTHKCTHHTYTLLTDLKGNILKVTS